MSKSVEILQSFLRFRIKDMLKILSGQTKKNCPKKISAISQISKVLTFLIHRFVLTYLVVSCAKTFKSRLLEICATLKRSFEKICTPILPLANFVAQTQKWVRSCKKIVCNSYKLISISGAHKILRLILFSIYFSS